jgi:hypothetical protein
MKPPLWEDVPRNGCLAACLAAVMEVPVQDVPKLVDGTPQWPGRVMKWCHSQGWHATFLSTGKTNRQRHRSNWPEPEATGFPAEHFVAIIAPWSEGKAHAVVMHGDRVVYDPSFTPRRRYQKRGITIIRLRKLVPVSVRLPDGTVIAGVGDRRVAT